MSPSFQKISTTVQNATTLIVLRLEFLIGSWLLPEVVARKAGQVFFTPGNRGRERARRMSTAGAHEAVFEIDGERLQVYVWGQPDAQPYVLFAHGWASHATRIAPWLEPLRREGYAVVAFDQAAHGRSSGAHTTLPDFACHLLAVARRFGPAAAVVGHSLGGAATALALSHGLVAERAVLIAPAADPLAAVERFARFLWLPAYLGRRMFAGFERAMRFDASELQAHATAPRIARPALIVHDLEDPEVPWAEGERYARYWREARLLSTRGLGHNRIVEDPDVIAATLRFLRGETVGDRVVSSSNLPYGWA